MALAFAIIGTLLAYSASKYFPQNMPLLSNYKNQNKVKRYSGTLLIFLALFFLFNQYGALTGTFIWFWYLGMCLMVLVLALSYWPKTLYLFLAAALFFFIKSFL